MPIMDLKYLQYQLRLNSIGSELHLRATKRFFSYDIVSPEENPREGILMVRRGNEQALTEILLEVKDSGYLQVRGVSFDRLSHVLHEVFCSYEKWQLVKENATFLSPEVLVETGGALLQRPLLVVDKGYRYLAKNAEANSMFPYDYVSEEQIAALTWEKDFYDVQKQAGDFFFPVEGQKTLLCRNLFWENQYYARLMASFGEEKVSAVFQSIFDEIADALEQSLQARGADYCRGEKSAAFEKQMERLLNGQLPDGPDVLRQYGWEEEHCYQLIRFRMSERYPASVSRTYIHRKIAAAFADCCVLDEEMDFLCVRNITLSSGLDLYRVLAPFLRENLMKCGISNCCNCLSDIAVYRRQAADVLQIGMETDKEFWYFNFRDYAFRILLQYGTQRYPMEQLIAPAIGILQQYDREHKTELYATLCAYLELNENATHTAKKMNVQRSSLLKRLKRIEELTKTNITREHLYLSVSCHLMQEKCSIYKKKHWNNK